MPFVEETAPIAIAKLEARILFDRMVLEPNDEFSLALRNLLRVALRDEPDDRHSRAVPFHVTKRQCYRILNTIRDSFNNEISRSLADKCMDALLELETRAQVEDILRGTILIEDPAFDRTYKDTARREERG